MRRISVDQRSAPAVTLESPITENQENSESEFPPQPDSRPIGYEGFKLLTPEEKRRLFSNKRDDLYYKTFGRDVRKFLQDDFTDYTGYTKEDKGKNGAYFYKLLTKYAQHMRFAEGRNFDTEVIV